MDDLERVDARHLDLDAALAHARLGLAAGNEQPRLVELPALRDRDRDRVLADRKTSRIGPFIIIGLVRLLSTTATPVVVLRARRDRGQPLPSTSTRRPLAERPAHGVGDQPLVVGGQHFPEDRADVPGDVDRAAAALVLAGRPPRRRAAPRGDRPLPSAGRGNRGRRGTAAAVPVAASTAISVRAADDPLGAVEAGGDRVLAVERDIGVLDRRRATGPVSVTPSSLPSADAVARLVVLGRASRSRTPQPRCRRARRSRSASWPARPRGRSSWRGSRP